MVYIQSHLKKYPLMQIQDILKLLMQGMMGPTHLIQDVNKLKANLLNEYNQCKDNNINYDLIEEIKTRTQKNERVLVTTLTIRMAEELTNYLKSLNMKVAYLHSEVKTFERLRIIRDLRMGKYDTIIGINLLREGLDIPEVSLIAIMDADKQGFLRSERSLIQTIGRAARNQNGHVIMYADQISDAMEKAINETKRRRSIQEEYNNKHGIVPKTVQKEIRDLISNEIKDVKQKTNKKDIQAIENEMRKAAKELDFEKAMQLRDILFELKASNEKS